MICMGDAVPLLEIAPRNIRCSSAWLLSHWPRAAAKGPERVGYG